MLYHYSFSKCISIQPHILCIFIKLTWIYHMVKYGIVLHANLSTMIKITHKCVSSNHSKQKEFCGISICFHIYSTFMRFACMFTVFFIIKKSCYRIAPFRIVRFYWILDFSWFDLIFSHWSWYEKLLMYAIKFQVMAITFLHSFNFYCNLCCLYVQNKLSCWFGFNVKISGLDFALYKSSWAMKIQIEHNTVFGIFSIRRQISHYTVKKLYSIYIFSIDFRWFR